MHSVPITQVSRHNDPPPKHFELLTKCFTHIHVDIITMPFCKGYRYCLTIIDRFTKWPTAIRMEDMPTETIIRKLYKHWICHFGTPKTITTDQGTQFESNLFIAFSKIIMAERIGATPFDPESNGMMFRGGDGTRCDSKLARPISLRYRKHSRSTRAHS